MRTVKPERELKEWEKAGWSREPRNGREWRRLKAGKSEPEATIPPSTRRCKRHGKTLFKCTLHFDIRSRKTYEQWFCPRCKSEANVRWQKANPEKAKRWRDEYQRRIKEHVADFDKDGVATVSSGWVIRHQADIVEAVRDGKSFIVEYMGDVAYIITR